MIRAVITAKIRKAGGNKFVELFFSSPGAFPYKPGKYNKQNNQKWNHKWVERLRHENIKGVYKKTKSPINEIEMTISPAKLFLICISKYFLHWFFKNLAIFKPSSNEGI